MALFEPFRQNPFHERALQPSGNPEPLNQLESGTPKCEKKQLDSISAYLRHFNEFDYLSVKITARPLNQFTAVRRR